LARGADRKAGMMHALERFSEIERVRQDIVGHLRARLAAAEIALSAEQALLLARLDDKARSVGYLQMTAYFGSNVSYNLRALEHAGYVARRGTSEDRRYTLIQITDRGSAVRAFVAKELDALPQLDCEKLIRRLAAA
jgi:DNA-binding MarR family transcriptional regulator